MSRDIANWRNGVLVVLVLAVVFSQEFSVLTDISPYASVNTEDIAILFVILVFFHHLINESSYTIPIRFQSVIVTMVLMSTWIIITVLVASVRASESVAATMLWTIKWFEVVVCLIAVQTLVNRDTSRTVGGTLILSGIVVSLIVIGQKVTQTKFRPHFFFGNPNPLAGFLVLITISCLAWVLYENARSNGWTALCLGGIILSSMAVLSTLSRSGLLNLSASAVVFVLMSRKQIPSRHLLRFVTASGAGLAALLLTFPISKMRRFTNWFQYSNGTIVLTDKSFNARLTLIEKGINLFLEQPIFGYGWFATPSRVGYLDVYVTTLLVDVGIIGLVLMAAVHVAVFRTFLTLRQRGASVYGTTGAAWTIGMIVQSIGGAFVRSPTIFIIWFVLLGIAWSEADRRPTDRLAQRSARTGSHNHANRTDPQ